MGLKGVFLFTPILTIFLVVVDMQMFSYRSIWIFFHIENYSSLFDILLKYIWFNFILFFLNFIWLKYFFIQVYFSFYKLYLIQFYFNFYKFYLIKKIFYSSLFDILFKCIWFKFIWYIIQVYLIYYSSVFDSIVFDKKFKFILVIQVYLNNTKLYLIQAYLICFSILF